MDLAIDQNPIRQLLLPEQTAAIERCDGRTVSIMLDDGQRFRVIQSHYDVPTGERALVVLQPFGPATAPDLGNGAAHWVGELTAHDPADVLASLDGAFSFVQEDRARGRAGLRLPQRGAVHAMLGLWTTGSPEPATVVMPTGTGKTEAMVALLACVRPGRLLVVVPSDALRAQLATKFESFGVLQRCGVIAPTALRPVVGQVQHGFASPSSSAFAAACNVIIV